MTYYKATIDILIEADDEAQACDAVSEGLRPMLRRYAENPEFTAWIDWGYRKGDDGYLYPMPHDGHGFEGVAGDDLDGTSGQDK